mgnify:CR=1 FL=1
MSKLNKILLTIIVILLIIFGVVIYWQKVGFKNEPSYWAVYTASGDIYFGKLSWFPKMSLSNVWYLQKNTQDAQNPFSLARFKQSAWGPEDKIYLNRKNIIWKARLDENSQVLKFIKNQQTE